MQAHKYIYGLKQAAFKFNQHLHQILTSYDMKPTISDECVYTKTIDNYLLIIAIHVDDLLVLSPTSEGISTFKSFLRSHFDISVQQGNELSYLGLSIIRNRSERTTTVSQHAYLQTLLTKFHTSNMRQRTTPMDLNYPTKAQNQNNLYNKSDYLSLIMSLMYLARFTRPDILFPTTFLATKCNAPTNMDMAEAIKIVQYLAYTGTYAYTFNGDSLKLQFHIDASHGIHPDGRGHTAIAATFGASPVFTRSSKQKLVALHSTDAEIYAVVEGITYVIWIRVFLSELQFEIDGPVPIYQDNTSAMLIYNGGGQFKRSKHLLIKRNYIKDLLDKRIIDFHYLESKQIPTDPISKPVPGSQIRRMLEFFKIVSLHTHN
jgi:hypothetical protein